MLGPKVFGHSQYSGEEVEAAKTAFYDDILRRMNKMLAGQQRYLIARNEPTAVDIIFYNEVSTALMMSRIRVMLLSTLLPLPRRSVITSLHRSMVAGTNGDEGDDGDGLRSHHNTNV